MDIRSCLNLICERLTFDQILQYSDPARLVRSQTVRMPAQTIEAFKDHQTFLFNCKAFPSYELKRHKGYIRFFAPDDPNTPLEQTLCEVGCDCKDFKFRHAWVLSQHDSAEIGPSSISQCIDRAPRVTNPTARIGVCKHILALRNFIYGQDSHFVPSEDTEDSTSRRSKLIAKAAESERLASLVAVANGAVIDQDGVPIKAEQPDTSGTVPAAPADAIVGKQPSKQVPPKVNPMQRELALRQRQQQRTAGINPDKPPVKPIPGAPVAKPPERTNPRNQPNPRNPTNRQPKKESLELSEGGEFGVDMPYVLLVTFWLYGKEYKVRVEVADPKKQEEWATRRAISSVLKAEGVPSEDFGLAIYKVMQAGVKVKDVSLPGNKIPAKEPTAIRYNNKRESVAQTIGINMQAEIKLIQEMVDAAQAEVQTQAKVATPSEQALTALQGIESLLRELVQLNKAPEPEEEVPVAPEAGPEEPPTEEVAPAAPSNQPPRQVRQ